MLLSAFCFSVMGLCVKIAAQSLSNAAVVFARNLFGLLALLPWLRPLVVANAGPLLGLAAAVTVLVALNQVHRPWYVELRRQGLAGAPRRVWRVQGWRRSGRLMGELAAAIREGRIDNRRAVILRFQGPR